MLGELVAESSVQSSVSPPIETHRFGKMPLRVRLWRLIFEWSWVDRILRRRALEVIERTGVQRHLKADGRYLDIGTGAGHIVERLVRLERARNIKYLGMDPVWKPTPRVLSRVRKRHAGRLVFLRGDGTRLPVGDESVDGVSMFFVLHHIPYPLQVLVLAEMKRVLRSDGFVVLAEDTPDDQAEWQIMAKRDRRLNFEPPDEEHYYRSGTEWRTFLAEQGFDVVDESYWEEHSRWRGEGMTRHRGLILRPMGKRET